MNARTLKLNRYRSKMAEVLRTNEDASKVENRYRLIRATLLAEFPKTVGDIEKETMIELLKDVTYLDRVTRKATEGKQIKLKRALEKDFIENILN